MRPPSAVRRCNRYQWAGLRRGAQDGFPLTPECIYTGGQHIASPWTGLSFVVPAGMQAQYDADQGGIVLRSSDMRMAVVGVSKASPEELGSAFIDRLAEQGIRLAAQTLDQVDERTIRATYTALTDDGNGLVAAASTERVSSDAHSGRCT